MRILLAIHNAYTDHTSGAAQTCASSCSGWRKRAMTSGFSCTARFDARPPGDLMQHLAEHGVSARRSPPSKAFLRAVKRVGNLGPGRPVLDFGLERGRGPHADDEGGAEHARRSFEADQFLFLLDEILSEFTPGVLCQLRRPPRRPGRHAAARAAGALVVFTLRNCGYKDRRYFDHVDHVFTTSPYLETSTASESG